MQRYKSHYIKRQVLRYKDTNLVIKKDNVEEAKTKLVIKRHGWRYKLQAAKSQNQW